MAKLHIPTPCHEKWSEMTTVRHDCRHCAVCEKSVVDFTLKTDAEILEELHQTNKKVCGVFLADQLERPIFAIPSNRGTHGFKAIAASLAAILSVQQATAQQPATPLGTEQKPAQTRDIPSALQVYELQKSDSIRTISGKIIHRKSHKPIPDCTVTIIGASYKTWASTDENGIFSITFVMGEIDENPLVLRLKLYGYEPQEVELPIRAKSEDLAMMPIRYKLKKQEQIVMGCPAFIP